MTLDPYSESRARFDALLKMLSSPPPPLTPEQEFRWRALAWFYRHEAWGQLLMGKVELC